MERVSATVDGRVLAAARWGRGPTAPLLVAVPGAGCDHHVFAPLAAQLAGVSLLAVDLPGRGDSIGPAPSSAQAAARVLADFLAALGVERPWLLGHSYGGAVALAAALAGVPLAGLVLASSGARLRVHPAILATMRAAEAAGPLGPPTSGWSAHADASVVAAIDAGARAVASATHRADWEAADAFDVLGALDGVRCPTLILGGEADRLTPPKYARYLAEHIRGAQLRLLPGEGHWLVAEAAPAVAAAITDFISAARS